eukprot:8359028-Lingulodinium_polyedra.AAC.1
MRASCTRGHTHLDTGAVGAAASKRIAGGLRNGRGGDATLTARSDRVASDCRPSQFPALPPFAPIR